MAKVTIDAGHGGYDSGAVYNGRAEKNDNLEIALAVGELLQQNGVEVEYTRTTDVYDSPTMKAQIANEHGSDVFISFHRNSSPNANTYSGVETLIYDEGGIKEDMANAINMQLDEAGLTNLGTKIRKDLTVLRRTNMPALLVEVGFINTDADNTLLDENFDAVTRAIANGITQTLSGMNENGMQNRPETDMSMWQQDQIVPPAMGAQVYWVQVGLYRYNQNAVNIAYELDALGFPVEIKESGGLCAVQIGPFTNQADAVEAENQLQMLGYETFSVIE